MNRAMWLFLVGLFASTLCAVSCESLQKDDCERLRNLYVEQLKTFDLCAIQNAVPVKMCSACVGPYIESLRAFQDMIIMPDPKSARERCIDRYINHDTLNVLWTEYQSSRNLWNSAACTNCFVNACDPDKFPSGSNYTIVCQPDERLVEVNNQTDNLMQCLRNSDKNQGNVCNDCLNAYNMLANHYSQLRATPNGVCFEAVDQLNRTNSIWYGIRNCPRPEVKMTVGWTTLIIIIGIVFVGGLSFGGFYGYTRYRQRGIYEEQTNSGSGTSTPQYS